MSKSSKPNVDVYYRMLEIAPGASESEIMSAFRKRTKEVHPDLNDDEDAEDDFKFLKKSRDIVERIEVEGKPASVAVGEVYNRETENGESSTQNTSSETETDGRSERAETTSTTAEENTHAEPDDDGAERLGPEVISFISIAVAAIVSYSFTAIARDPGVNPLTGIAFVAAGVLLVIGGGHYKIAGSEPIEPMKADLRARSMLVLVLHMVTLGALYISIMAGNLTDTMWYMIAGMFGVVLPVALVFMEFKVGLVTFVAWVGISGGLSRPFLWADFSPYLLGLVVNVVWGAVLLGLVSVSALWSLRIYFEGPMGHESGMKSYGDRGWSMVPLIAVAGITIAATVYTPWIGFWGFAAAPIALLGLAFARGIWMGWDFSPQ